MSWRPHGHARVDPNSPSAFAVCDRCQRLFNRRDLIWEMQWRGPRLMKTGYLVDKSCLDVPQQQLRPRILPTDPVPIFNPRPEFFAFENGLQGFTLYTLDVPNNGNDGPVFSKNYVLDQIALLSGIAVPSVDDDSGVIFTSQVAQAMIPLLPPHQYLLIFNPTALPLAVSFGTAGFLDTTSIVLSTGQALLWSSTQHTQISANAMTVAGFSIGQAYYAWATSLNTGLINDGGVLQLEFGIGYPTDDLGLPPGAVWNNGFVVAVVPGVIPDPSAPPVIFGTINAEQLLVLGGGNLPLIQPSTSNQLWNNGGEVAVTPASPDSGLSSDGGVLVVEDGEGYPPSPAGLSVGALWSNDGAVSVVGPTSPDPSAPPVFFNSITATELFALGGGNLPSVAPGTGTGQLWNNGGEVAIA